MNSRRTISSLLSFSFCWRAPIWLTYCCPLADGRENVEQLRVIFFQRRPQGVNFSIERLFAEVRRALPQEVRATVAISRFSSRGFFRRCYNIIEAALRQGQVNHVTGDVHFLCYLLRRNRTVLTICDLVSVHRLSGWRRIIFVFFWYWLPIRSVAIVTVISEATKQELVRYLKFDAQRIRVVHACIPDDFRPFPKLFNSSKPVVLQIGTGPNKNLERVAEALCGIPCKLRVIGNLSEFQRQILSKFELDYSAESNISNDQIVDEYYRCDMLVFASTYEGFGMPIVEAQATGRAVVTSNVLSMPEVAGDAACLINPFHVESIRSGILNIIQNSSYREELVRKGFVNADRFRAEKIAQEYLAIYKSLVDGD